MNITHTGSIWREHNEYLLYDAYSLYDEYILHDEYLLLVMWLKDWGKNWRNFIHRT